MKFEFNVSAASFSENDWVINQDNIFVDEFVSSIGEQDNFSFRKLVSSDCVRVFAVSDGIGGGSYGEKASKMTSESISKNLILLKSGNLKREMANTFEKANKCVKDMYSDSYKSGGATISMLAFDKENVYCYNLGDSPVFRLRKNEKKAQLEQINNEHTLAKENPDLEDPDKEWAQNMLTKYIGFSDNDIKESDVAVSDLQLGDIYLICSDGITKGLSFERITDFLINKDKKENIALEMVKEARKKSADDTTAIVIYVQKHKPTFKEIFLVNRENEVK